MTSVAIALALAAAACGEQAGNMMAPQGNALKPADIDAALGPEPGTDETLNVDSNSAVADELQVDANTTSEPPDASSDED